MSCKDDKTVRWGPIKLDGSGENDLLLSADFSGVREFAGTLTVLSAAGTSPTLDVQMVDGPENDHLFVGDSTSGGFTQMTGAGNEKIYVTEFSRFVNFKYALGGTNPEFIVTLDLNGKG